MRISIRALLISADLLLSRLLGISLDLLIKRLWDNNTHSIDLSLGCDSDNTSSSPSNQAYETRLTLSLKKYASLLVKRSA